MTFHVLFQALFCRDQTTLQWDLRPSTQPNQLQRFGLSDPNCGELPAMKRHAGYFSPGSYLSHYPRYVYFINSQPPRNERMGSFLNGSDLVPQQAKFRKESKQWENSFCLNVKKQQTFNYLTCKMCLRR